MLYLVPGNVGVSLKFLMGWGIKIFSGHTAQCWMGEGDLEENLPLKSKEPFFFFFVNTLNIVSRIN